MLTREKKNEILKDLKGNLEKSQAIFLTNLVGIPANSAVKLRRQIRDAGGSVHVVKNTLLKMVLKDKLSEKLLNIKGTHAVAFAYNEPVKVVKALYDAGKEFEIIDLKSGMFDGKELTKADMEVLAKLPSRDQMLATLLATFNAPVSAFVRVLSQVKDLQEKASA